MQSFHNPPEPETVRLSTSSAISESSIVTLRAVRRFGLGSDGHSQSFINPDQRLTWADVCRARTVNNDSILVCVAPANHFGPELLITGVDCRRCASSRSGEISSVFIVVPRRHFQPRGLRKLCRPAIKQIFLREVEIDNCFDATFRFVATQLAVSGDRGCRDRRFAVGVTMVMVRVAR